MEKPWLTFYERDVPYHIDYPEIPVYQLLEDSARKYPDKRALIFFDVPITYRELIEYVDRFASALKYIGIKKGDRVALMLPNCPQFVIAFYGILKAGGIVVQVNPLYVERELEFLLNDSEAETIITLNLLYPKVKGVFSRSPLRRIIITHLEEFFPTKLKILFPLKLRLEGRYVRVPKGDDIYFMKELLEIRKSDLDIGINPKEDIALLQYTGGTTGTPKGAMLTHYNLVVNTIQCVSWYTNTSEGKEVVMGVLPFFHVYGMTVALNFAMRLAATLILVPKFDVKKTVKLLEKYRVTLFPGAPTIYIAINSMKNIEKYDLKSIEACISGSAPLPLKVKEDFEKLTGAKLVEGYGLSEASPVTHCNPIYGLNKPGSIGLPFPDTEAKIVDLETGEKDLPPGEIGELVVRGPQVMKGYWRNERETSVALRNGWLYTGDIARMDKDGYFYIVDRKKDMICVSGFNVYPREVEEVLYKHPKVKEAAVIGIPHPTRGETIKAFIVLKDDERADEEEMKDFLKENLAKYKVPEFIEFRKELPKNTIGKVLRRVLREENP
jgi:long-chain acyl-CoA synthetase